MVLLMLLEQLNEGEEIVLPVQENDHRLRVEKISKESLHISKISSPVLDQITKRGKEIYEQDLKRQLEETHRGKYVVINIETGQYVIADTDVEVIEKFREEFPRRQGYFVRVGVPFRA